MKLDKNAVYRFLDKARRHKVTGCWEWQSCLNDKGYGTFRINRKTLRAHRIAYEMFCGEIPDGLLVCHKCDNRRCVNPVHLFVGTNADNTADAMAKGRIATGATGAGRRPSKLTANDVEAIRLMRKEGAKLREIGERFGISPGYAQRVAACIKWSKLK